MRLYIIIYQLIHGSFIFWIDQVNACLIILAQGVFKIVGKDLAAYFQGLFFGIVLNFSNTHIDRVAACCRAVGRIAYERTGEPWLLDLARKLRAQGVDFEAHDGYIALRRSPAEVLPLGHFTVIFGYERVRAPYLFSMHLDGDPYDINFVAEYYRGGRSVNAFGRAIAQAAGLYVVPQDDSVLATAAPYPGVTRYSFQNAGVVDVLYHHEALQAGTDVARGTVVGRQFKIATGGAADRLVLDGEFSLDGMLPVKGLSVRPGKVRVDFESSHAGHPHARVHLIGADAVLEDFWERQRLHEIRTGHYLSSTLGITDEMPALDIDFIAHLRVVYGERLIVIRRGLRDADPIYKSRMDAFIDREKPLNCVILISD